MDCSGLEGTTRGVMMTPSPEREWGWLPSGQVTCAAGVVHLLPTRPGLSGHIGLGLPRPPLPVCEGDRGLPVGEP